MTSRATSQAQAETAGIAMPLHEGEDGLFSQSWFPICLSTEIAPGVVKGFDFLGGRVIVVRDGAGKARVLSAFCPHLGADLGGGEVIDGAVRCPFHHWSYNTEGRCVRTGSGDPVPPTAQLFRFPTMEKYGMVFAFNGTEPLYDLPDFPKPPEKLRWRIGEFHMKLPCDPWVICCNTPDMQHISVVHGIKFDHGEPHNAVTWTPHAMQYQFSGEHRGGSRINFRVAIHGTTVYYQEGEINGRWFGFVSPMSLSRPGQSRLFLAVAVEDDPSDPEGTQKFLDDMYVLEEHVATEDLPIVERARFRPGTLSKSDRTLARFLKYLKDHPRAHPSKKYIS